MTSNRSVVPVSITVFCL